MNYLITFLILGIGLSQNPIPIPGTLSGTNFDLTLQHGQHEFYEGFTTETMGVNGNILGPTLILNQGEHVDIQLHNTLEDTTTIHWHGLHVSPENDGGPHTTIPPGTTWNPNFTVLDKAGTYWYHPHLHERTNLHASLGISGFIIVKDDEEANLNIPRTYGVDDFPLAIQTKTFDENKQIVVPSNADSSLMVNVTKDPMLEVPAQVVRFRLLNGSSLRVFNLGLNNNDNFFHIGTDGGLLEAPIETDRLLIIPGGRQEVLIDFSEHEGDTISIMAYNSDLDNGIFGATYPGMMTMQSLDNYNPNPLNGNDFQIIQFVVTNPTDNPIHEIPSTLAMPTPYLEENSDTTRTFTFSSTEMGMNALNGDFLINGSEFEMDVINEIVPLNNTEIWSVTNQSPIAHPFHIHDIQFYILDRNGVLPPLSERGRTDVVLVYPMETVRVITKFEDFADEDTPYMYHCHMLTHEDMGMMGQFIVVDESTASTDAELVPSESSILFPCFPNPFNPKTSIQVELSQAEFVELSIFNILGEQINQIFDGKLNDGMHTFHWNGANSLGEKMSSGMYFVVLSTATQSASQKIIFLN